MTVFESVFEVQELKVAIKQPFGVLCGIFQRFERKYLIEGLNCSIINYVFFLLLMLVVFTRVELEISPFHNV